MKTKTTQFEQARAFAIAWPDVRKHLPAEHRAAGDALVALWLAGLEQKSRAGSANAGKSRGGEGKRAHIVALAAEGMSGAAIAARVEVSPGYVSRVLRK